MFARRGGDARHPSFFPRLTPVRWRRVSLPLQRLCAPPKWVVGTSAPSGVFPRPYSDLLSAASRLLGGLGDSLRRRAALSCFSPRWRHSARRKWQLFPYTCREALTTSGSSSYTGEYFRLGAASPASIPGLDPSHWRSWAFRQAVRARMASPRC